MRIKQVSICWTAPALGKSYRNVSACYSQESYRRTLFDCVWLYCTSQILYLQTGGETRPQQKHHDLLYCNIPVLCRWSGTTPATSSTWAWVFYQIGSHVTLLFSQHLKTMSAYFAEVYLWNSRWKSLKHEVRQQANCGIQDKDVTDLRRHISKPLRGSAATRRSLEKVPQREETRVLVTWNSLQQMFHEGIEEQRKFSWQHLHGRAD